MPTRPLPGSSPWSYAIRGIVGILFGALMFLMPGIGLATFVLAYGIFSLVDGIIASLAAFLWTRSRGVDWALLIGGLLSIGIGLFFLLQPLLSLAAMSLLIAAWMVAVGIATIVSALHYRREIKGEWLLVIAGLFPVIFGIYLLINPIVAAALLPLMIGGYALFWGVLLLGSAFRLWRGRGDDEAVEA